jgi:PAS domain S-box-containing protein
MPDKDAKYPPGGEAVHAQRCQALIQHAFDVIVIVDADATILYASPSTYPILGHRPEDVIGWDGHEFLHPNDRAIVETVHDNIVRFGGSSAPAYLRLRHKNGDWRIVQMVAQNMLDDPSIGGIVVNWRDVTDYRRIQEKYEKSFSCNPDSVTITTLAEGRFLVANEGFELHSGYSCEEVTGKTVYDFHLWKDPSDRDKLLSLIEEKRSVRNYQSEFVLKSGKIRIGLVSAEVINLEEEPCALMVVRDITEIKRNEQQLHDTTNRLAEEHREVVRKNVALNEVLSHLEHDKTVFRHEVSSNLDNLLRPLIEKLESDPTKLNPGEVDKIRVGLQRILGEEIDDFQNNLTKLTPRELDVCELIRAGHSTKEIAEQLHLSSETVHKHRQSIRKKLQIDRRGLSLASYLRTRM